MAVALRLKEYEWTKNFIHDKARLISRTFRKNARTYNSAKLFFHQGNYSQVKKLLLQVEYEDVFYNLDSKTMLLKIYFEEGEDIALEALAQTFIVYLRRNKLISKAYKKRYSNFVRFVVRISQLWGPKKEELENMEVELYPGDEIADVAWLREVLDARKAGFLPR